MPINEGLMSSDSYDWGTPQEFFNKVDQEFGFTLDVCASWWNAKCERFFSIEDDGLSQEWSGVVWMNPPYGKDIAKWMSKAVLAWRGGLLWFV
jgi:phage N-6-adenine-methyltransferase